MDKVDKMSIQELLYKLDIEDIRSKPIISSPDVRLKKNYDKPKDFRN